MAPSRHCGILRFRYPPSGQRWLVADANPGGSAVQIHPETRRITGKNSNSARNGPANFAVYYVAVFDQPFQSYGTWDGTGARDGKLERSGQWVGAYVGFSGESGTVAVRVGTSLISLEQAERNLNAEIPGFDLDRAASDACAEWERELGRIEVQGGSAAERRTFYTALSRTMQYPRMLAETGAAGEQVHYGLYDGKLHPGPMFSDTGFWDTFRAEFPLLALLQPKRDAEIVRAMVNVYDEAGWIPKWANPHETNVMIGTHGDSVIADAYMKGIRD
jgi:predicted alpha-1,2-mannosidase